MSFANVNGISLYYESFGQGEPVVFIHGVGIHSRVWEFQREFMSRHFNMIVYDLRGSGKSSATPKVKHTAELMSRDLKGLLDHLGLERVHIVGLSLGAAVAMKYAVEYPAKVQSLVLSGAFADLRGILGLISKYFSGIIGKLLMYRVFGELATRIMLPSAPRQELLYYHKHMISINKEEVLKYRQILNSYTITTALNKITVPTLILYGEYEPVMHPYGRLIQKNIRDSRLEIVEGVGHGWNGEEPELFNRKVMEFLRAHSMG